VGMNWIKNQEWLKEHLRDDKVRIIDCRFTLGNPDAGKEAFQKSHIPGAIYFDLEVDLSGVPMEHGGRHPLPNLNRLKEKLELAGIDSTTTVIAYDDGEGAFAGRFWWILSFMGHANIFILNGGFKKWLEAGCEVNQDEIFPKKTFFEINLQESMNATYEDVRDCSQNGTAILIDSRARTRFLGLEEPIDKKPGHIPGAINKVWEDGFVNGYWNTSEEQKGRFAELDPLEPIIVYCGSGVTATPNIIALKEAGYENVKLYVGSYSDWVSYKENPVELGE
jgi:thiosulfate/3-mercaptopyruvate sulfurtransferase